MSSTMNSGFTEATPRPARVSRSRRGLSTIRSRVLGVAIAAMLLRAARALADSGTPTDWPVTGGDAGGSRYSPLAEIDRSNVAGLKVAWTYRHGDVRSGGIFPD